MSKFIDKEKVDAVFINQLCDFYQSFNLRIECQSFGIFLQNKDGMVEFYTQMAIKKEFYNKDQDPSLVKIKKWIWENLDDCLVVGGKDKPYNKARFYLKHGTIYRSELFALCLLFESSKEEAVDLINRKKRYMFINYSDPYDLLFDYSLTNHIGINDYLSLKNELNVVVNDVGKQRFEYDWQGDMVGTKTHLIANNYRAFLNKNSPLHEVYHQYFDLNNHRHTPFIKFVKDNIDYFHIRSHYFLKLLYALLENHNQFYAGQYLNHEEPYGITVYMDHTANISFTSYSKTLTSIIKNQGKGIEYFYEEFNVDYPEAFLREYDDYVKTEEKTKNESNIDVFTFDADINRFLLIMTAFLCGCCEKDELNQILKEVSKIRPEIQPLSEKSISDFWILSACQFVEKAISEQLNPKDIFIRAKDFLKATRIIMIQENNKRNDPYLSQVLDEFTSETMLKYDQ